MTANEVAPQQSERVEASSRATVRFFARNDNESSTGLLEEGTQALSLPLDPIPIIGCENLGTTRYN
jgi:hypothetical protein